jgi:hypothetical protein
MTTLNAFFDESGHSSTHKFVAVAGFIAPEPAWRGFDDQWNAALRAAGLVTTDGRLLPFHMTDFEARRKHFKDWDKPRREHLLGQLIGTIIHHQLYATGFVISVDWWTSVDWHGSTPEHEPLQDPYHHAIQGAIQTMLRLTSEPLAPDLNHATSVTCTFADQTEYGGRAKAYLTALATYVSTPERTVTITFAPTDRLPQLQAADLLAFELRWRFTKPEIDRWPLRQILDSRRAAFGAVPQNLETAAESFGGDILNIDHADRVLRVKPEIRKAARRANRRPTSR